MCSYHWRFVDKPLQRALYRWSRFRRSAPEYKELCQQAIAAAAHAPQPLNFRVLPQQSDPDIYPF